MSQSIALIFPDEIRLTIIKDYLSKKWKVAQILRINGQIDIQIRETSNLIFGSSYVTFGTLGPAIEIIEDYKECDFLDIEFPESLKNYVFYIVDFNNPVLCNKAIKEVLSNLAGNIKECWIDSYYRKVIRADKVLANLNADLSFEWADQ
jgi:hypothetical protein